MSADPAKIQAVGGTHRELWEVVCGEIRDLIIRGEFAPGERLVEAALAERFAVSRGPVRTALTELERVGLVTSVPRRGMQVTRLRLADIDELYDVTCALEQMAARNAAENASPEQVSQLYRLLDELDQAVQTGDPVQVVEADLELHSELVAASGNARLLRLWLQISEAVRFAIAITRRAMPEVEWSTYQYPIIEAVASHDPDRAERAVVECFRVAHAQMKTHYAEAFDE